MRSSALNNRLFDLFTPTATTTSSNNSDARPMMSRWPLVTGSNDPGHAALRTLATLSQRPGRRVQCRLAVRPDLAGLERLRPEVRPVAAGPFDHHVRARPQPPAVSEGGEVRAHLGR